MAQACAHCNKPITRWTLFCGACTDPTPNNDHPILGGWKATCILAFALFSALSISVQILYVDVFFIIAIYIAAIASSRFGNTRPFVAAILLISSALVVLWWPWLFTGSIFIALFTFSSAFFLLASSSLSNRRVAFCLLILALLAGVQAKTGILPEHHISAALQEVWSDGTNFSFRDATVAALLSIGIWRWTLAAAICIAISGAKSFDEAGPCTYPRLWREVAFRPVAIQGFTASEFWPIEIVVALLNGACVLVSGGATALKYAWVWFSNTLRMMASWLLGTGWYLLRASGCVLRSFAMAAAHGAISLLHALALAGLFVLSPLLITLLLIAATHSTSESMVNYLNGSGPFALVGGWLVATIVATWLWLICMGWIAALAASIARRDSTHFTTALFMYIAGPHAKRLLLQNAKLAGSSLLGYIITRVTMVCLLCIVLFDCIGAVWHIGPFSFGWPAVIAVVLVIVPVVIWIFQTLQGDRASQ
jgi:hypothetical protein